MFVGTSVDGFIARPDGAVDFLGVAEPIEGDMGFAAFMAGIDVMVMGRNTFDTVIDMITADESIGWPYGQTPVMVMTSRPLEIPPALTETVEATAADPVELLEMLADRGHEHAYIDGGLTVQSFLRAGLVDELIVTDVPVLIGSGRALFGELDSDIVLDHVETIVFENGCVQTRYELGGRPGDS